jgi:hypothetical protein
MTPLHRLTALVTGLTSNPTIFRAAVLGSDRYASRIAALAGRPPLEVYDALAVEDAQAAADVLAPLYARTGGADGFVSLEVAPALAGDADGTVAAARELWARVGRPNTMIKIPATIAGVEATRRATADGINVNVTPLFSVERYAAVIDAYLDGLEERLLRREPARRRRRQVRRVDGRTAGRATGHQPRFRYSRTASTRRWSSGACLSPSLSKMLVTCRSTAGTVTISSAAIPPLERPSAISAMTSRSRGVSSSSGLLSRRRPTMR